MSTLLMYITYNNNYDFKINNSYSNTFGYFDDCFVTV